MTPKQRAAQAALQFVASGMVVGLGTGSTADFFLTALAQALRDKQLRDIKGIPTSKQSERRAIGLQIPLTTLAHDPLCDVTVDGADEVAPGLDLIKGLGGALLREKVVAQNSRKLVIIADEGKVVTGLGAKSPLPVEVAQFGYETQEHFLRDLGADPRLRMGAGGMVFVTDNGNFIYDCHFPAGIANPTELEHAMKKRAGIVETGLFLGLASVALIGSDDAVRELRG
ncbi:MAG TPA: ribose 5-phosphate isomerase A [Tepidisphaeraceae bacterium]|jgi:ribose 5-phosphate isomerase A